MTVANLTPTAAEMDAALVFTADGYSDANGVDHVTAAQRAVDAAGKADLEAALAYQPSVKSETIYNAQMDRLSTILLCIRSEALRTAISAAVDVKREERDQRVAHGRLEAVSVALARSMPGSPLLPNAEAQAAKADEAWLSAWEQLSDAGTAVLGAPTDGFDDILFRSEAYLCLLGDRMEPTPDSDSVETMLEAMTAVHTAVKDLAERRPEDEDAGCGYGFFRRRSQNLVFALRESERLSDVVAAGGVVEDHVLQSAEAAVAKADMLEREAANKILANEPEDLRGLLTLFDIVIDAVFQLDVSTYAARARGMPKGPLTIEALRSNDYDTVRQAMTVIASRIASLADLHLPSDYKDLWDSTWAIPNAHDAVMVAYEAGLDPAELTNIQLVGRPDHQLPVLHFNSSDGPVMVDPEQARVWKPVQ